MAFPSGAIDVPTVCDSYGVARNMLTLAGKTYYNADGSSAIVPNTNINLNLFRGKYRNPPTPPVPISASGSTAIASSADGTKLVTGADTNGYIYTSADSGATWIQRSVPGGGKGNYRGFASSANGQYLVTGNIGGTIYRSADYGVTWTQGTISGSVAYTGDWRAFACSSTGQTMITGNSGFTVYMSTDYGVSWSSKNVTNSGNGNGVWTAFACSADGTILYAGYYAYQLYYSTNSGSTWLSKTIGVFNPNFSGISCSSDGSKFVLACNDINSSGYTFTGSPYIGALTQGTLRKDWRAVASSYDGVYIVAATTTANGGYIYTSTDSGANWVQRDPAGGALNWYGVASSQNGDKLVAVSIVSFPTIYIYTSTTYGVNWTRVV